MVEYWQRPQIRYIVYGNDADKPAKALSRSHAYLALDTLPYPTLYVSDIDRNWTPVGTGGLSQATTLTDPVAQSGFNQLLIAPLEIDDALTIEGNAPVVNSVVTEIEPEATTFKEAKSNPTAATADTRGLTAINGHLVQVDDAGNTGQLTIDHRQTISVWPHMARVATGNAHVFALSTTQFFRSFGYQDPPALNDRREWDVLLDAGEYIFGGVLYKDTNQAVHTYKLDGTTIFTHDCYNNPIVNNYVFTRRVQIAEPGNYELSVEALSKNGASGNYYIGISGLWFTPVRRDLNGFSVITQG